VIVGGVAPQLREGVAHGRGVALEDVRRTCSGDVGESCVIDRSISLAATRCACHNPDRDGGS
jgi:hypothetical protein